MKAGSNAAKLGALSMRYSVLSFIVFATFAFAAVSQSAAPSADQAKKPDQSPPPAKWEQRVLDAFFPDARTVLVGPRPQWMTDVVTGNVKAGSNSTAGTSNANGDSAGGATGAVAWTKLISADALEDEVKSLQPQLADDVKTQPGFLGGGYKKSRKTLSLLAVAFAIINEYNGEVKWKNQAPAARDLFARAGYNCKAATEPVFRETKQCADDLSTLLRGETLPATKADTTNDWSKISDLLPLMSRFDLAEQTRIAPWTSTPGDFKKNAAALQQESEMLAALAEAISRPGMENADDDKFRGYAKALQKSALELRDATSAGNYEAARTAAGTLSKACANCHGDFR
jgi:hypothetical protein